jgi:benzil reductase ((S)-benzoin forming)
LATDVYMITGASSGLGAEFTKQLLTQDNIVFCLSRTENNDIKRLASMFRYEFIPIDLTRVEDLERTFEGIIATMDPSQIHTITLINNAATVTPIKHIETCSQEEILSSIQLNLTAPILLTSSFTRLTANWNVTRRVVNISSGSGQYPAPSMSLYCSAKSALQMFSRCVGLEQERKSNPVQVVSVDPGMMDTGMQNMARETDFELSGFFTKQKEAGNLTDPADVARDILRFMNSTSEVKNGELYKAGGFS